MSAGEAGVAVLWKPFMWVVGGLLTIIKGLVVYLWFMTNKKNNKTSKDLEDHKKYVRDNYYDKESIHLIHRPMQDTLERFVGVTEELREEVKLIRIQNARNGNERRD